MGDSSTQLVTRAGFDINHGVSAMALRNDTNDRNAREAVEEEERPTGKRGGRRGIQQGKLYAFGSGDYGRLGHGDNQPKKTAKLVEILRDKNITKFACGPRHTLALAADGTVYSWGYGGDGQLGHGDYQLQTMPVQIRVLKGEHVIDLSCGDKHSAALTSGGDVFTWGDGSLGQLGLGDFRKQHTPHRVMELQGKMILQISCAHTTRQTRTRSSRSSHRPHPAAAQVVGNAHRLSPRAPRPLVRRCGAYHTGCIDKEEQVYTWGQGGSGRLGHDAEQCVPPRTPGKRREHAPWSAAPRLPLSLPCLPSPHLRPRRAYRSDLAVPTIVESLQGKGIQGVKCFHEHTMALTVPLDGGQEGLFDESSQTRLLQRVKELEVKLARESFNARQSEERLENSKSAFIESEQNSARLQLQNDALLAERVDLYMKMQALESQLSIATSDKDNLDKQLRSLVNIPTKLEEIQSQGVRQIACGSRHILALSDSGDVYAWGTGSAGQLGLGKKRSFPSPQLVWGLMRKGVRQIAAGDAHSLALTYNGLVYSWGSSKVGQLGHGNRKTQPLPKLITYLDENVSREKSSTVRLIGAGARHSIAVLGNGELYCWGRPDFGRLGRTKNDAYLEPFLVESLFRREVAEERTDRSKALGKAEIAELLDQKMGARACDQIRPAPLARAPRLVTRCSDNPALHARFARQTCMRSSATFPTSSPIRMPPSSSRSHRMCSGHR